MSTLSDEYIKNFSKERKSIFNKRFRDDYDPNMSERSNIIRILNEMRELGLADGGRIGLREGLGSFETSDPKDAMREVIERFLERNKTTVPITENLFLNLDPGISDVELGGIIEILGGELSLGASTDKDKGIGFSFKKEFNKGGRIGFFSGMRAQEQKEKAREDRRASQYNTPKSTTAKAPPSMGFGNPPPVAGGRPDRDAPKGPPRVINLPTKEPVLKTRNILEGYKQHNINNQKLKNAVALGLISNNEYNILGGYDVNQTMGLDPFMTGVTSGLYNVYQTIKGDQPASEIYGDVKRNVEGSFGLPEELQTKYDNIMAMSSQEMTDQLADQKIAQMAGGGISRMLGE